MKSIIINENEVELKYTFNSFKYMEEFNLADLENIETKPFKIIKVTEILLIGALNNDPKKYISTEDISQFLEEYSCEESLMELLGTLMELLQDSNFFKNLQKNPKTTKKTK